MKKYLLILLLWPALLCAQSSQDVDEKAAITGSAVDSANDFLLLRDASVATGPALKKLTIGDVINVPGFFGNVSATELGYLDGVTSAIQTQLNAKQATLVSGTNIKTINLESLLGSGNVAVATSAQGALADTSVQASQLSTTGGANKVPQYDVSGYLKLGTTGQSTGGLRVPVGQKLSFEDSAGGIAGYLYNFGDHNDSYGLITQELIAECGRLCVYWTDAIQLGSASADRGRHYIMLNRLGNATVGDPYRESVAIVWSGRAWDGNSRVSNIATQWVPSGVGTGSLDFRVATETLNTGTALQLGTGTNAGKISSIVGSSLVFRVSDTGPVIPTGKVLKFSDDTTLASTDDIVTIAESVIPAVRTGSVDLVAGEVDVADVSVTNKTHIQLTHQVVAGTPGFLGYELAPATGFTITSSSATDTSRVTYFLVEGAEVNIPDAPAPTISGTNEITDTLTVTTNGGNEVYQWYSGVDAVSGETGTTYEIRPEDIGKDITCQEGGVASNAITAWHPDDESGYYAEYRADTGLNKAGGGLATVDGDEISQWDDVSGNARHMSHSTAGEYPKLDTAGAYPRVEFDVNDYQHWNNAPAARPQVAFVVAESVTSANTAVIFSTGDSGARMKAQQSVASETVANSNSAARTMTHSTRSILTAVTNATTNTIQVDGGTLGSVTETTGNGSKIGVGSLGGNSSFVGYIHHVVFYAGGTELDAAAKLRVRKYLKAKWATPGAL